MSLNSQRHRWIHRQTQNNAIHGNKHHKLQSTKKTPQSDLEHTSDYIWVQKRRPNRVTKAEDMLDQEPSAKRRQMPTSLFSR
jgi:hypothetical protein